MSNMNRDLSPINQKWLMDYCNKFTYIAGNMPDGGLKEALLRRVECVLDVLEAWQLRNVPIDQRGRLVDKK